MADAIHISLAYFPFFTHKLEANFSWRKTCVKSWVKGMQFFPLLAYQAERCRNLDRWGLNGAMGQWAIGMVWVFWHQRLDVHPPTLSHWVHNLKSRSAHKLGTSPPKWGLHMARSADQNINFLQDWCVTATDRATGWLRLGSYFVASAQSSKTDAACISLHVNMEPAIRWNLKHGVPKMNILMDWAIVMCQV